MNWLAIAALLVLLAGCGGRDPGDAQPVPDGAPLPSMLPAIPRGDGGRAASVSYNITLEGHEYFETNSQNGTFGQLFLNPGESGPTGWAIYRFSGLATDVEVDTLAVSMFDLSNGAEYYIALADYSSGRWQLLPRVAAGNTALFNFTADFDPSRHLRDDGSLFVAVVAHEASGMVDFLTLSSSGSLARPANLVASDARYSQRVAISWDPVAGAEQYELYSKEAGQNDEFYALLAQLPSTETSFDHTIDNPASRPAVYGTIYEYKVQATASVDESSPFSLPDEGERRIPAPTAVYASDRGYIDKVFIVWETLAHDTPPDYTYKLYRDAELILELTTEDELVTSYTDTGVSDFDAHEYYVVDSGPEGDSYPSPVDQGCLANWEEGVGVGITGPEVGIYPDMAIGPDGSTPVVSMVDSDDDFLRYARISGGTEETVTVGNFKTNMKTAVAASSGLPYIAFHNFSDVIAERGIYIARGKTAQPVAGPDGWDLLRIYDGPVTGQQVVMRRVGGRLAVMFLELAFDLTTLHYAYATTDNPDGPGDWVVTEVMEFPGDIPWYFDIDELDGLPVACWQRNDDAGYMKCDNLTPSGPGNWTSHAMPVSTASYDSATGIDMAVHDGIPHFVLAWDNEGDYGEILHLYPSIPEPAGEFDWLGAVAYSLLDPMDVSPPSLVFHDGFAWIAFSTDLAPTPVMLTPVWPQLPYPSGAWNVSLLQNRDSFEFSRDEVKLLEVDGSLACLYSGFRDGEGLFRRLYYQPLAAKP